MSPMPAPRLNYGMPFLLAVMVYTYMLIFRINSLLAYRTQREFVLFVISSCEIMCDEIIRAPLFIVVL